MLNWHIQHLARLMGAGYRIGIQRQFTEVHTPLADLEIMDRYSAATSKELPLRLIEITSIYSAHRAVHIELADKRCVGQFDVPPKGGR